MDEWVIPLKDKTIKELEDKKVRYLFYRIIFFIELSFDIRCQSV